jgi:hypothetical protein
MFNKTKKGKEFPADWKIVIICPIYEGNGKRLETLVEHT